MHGIKVKGVQQTLCWGCVVTCSSRVMGLLGLGGPCAPVDMDLLRWCWWVSRCMLVCSVATDVEVAWLFSFPLLLVTPLGAWDVLLCSGVGLPSEVVVPHQQVG